MLMQLYAFNLFFNTLILRKDSGSSTTLSLLIHAYYDYNKGGRNNNSEWQWFGTFRTTNSLDDESGLPGQSPLEQQSPMCW